MPSRHSLDRGARVNIIAGKYAGSLNIIAVIAQTS